jgi:hypothetical protein
MNKFETTSWQAISDALTLKQAETFYPTAKRASLTGEVKIKQLGDRWVFKVPASPPFRAWE